ncbi:RING-H2 finger protein ATL29-like isoform X2 [Hermetia illucens]|uniref:RING-H2 finger protein ATL29-like isoform X2 n=1 Tax=Hermetia illucens TaxID=343691 RepID=UPI0018CC1FCB|nr:RING-H2 finger protein ATL29-like isoform X2 [Hermetia illucens]
MMKVISFNMNMAYIMAQMPQTGNLDSRGLVIPQAPDLSRRTEIRQQTHRSRRRLGYRNHYNSMLNDLLFEVLSYNQAGSRHDSSNSRMGNPLPSPQVAQANPTAQVNETTSTFSDLNVIRTSSSTAIRRTDLNMKCSICLDSYLEPTSTLCGHVFCKECINASIACHQKCPLCNTELMYQSVHALYI